MAIPPTWPPTRALNAWTAWPSDNAWSWPPPEIVRPPLPASAVEYWHSELGIGLVGGAVDTWQGQIRGTILSAFTALRRVAYQPDGANFNGRNVVFCTAAGGRAVRRTLIAPPLTLTGTKPHVYMIMRLRTPLVAGNFPYRSQNTAGTALSAGMFADGGVPPAMQCFWFPLPTVNMVAPPLTATRWETFINAAGNIVGRIAGVPTVGAAAGLTAPGDLDRIGFGANPNDGQYTDTSFALMLVCSSEITGSELAALDAYAANYWAA